MGRLPAKDRHYAIQHMWERHYMIVRLYAAGMRAKDVAEEVGCTPAMVSYTINSPIARRHLEFLRKTMDGEAIDIAERLQELAPSALATMEHVLKSPTTKPELKVKVGQDILDRAGHAAVKNLDVTSRTVHLTAQDVEDIKHRAEEKRQAARNGLVINDDEVEDAVFVEVDKSEEDV